MPPNVSQYRIDMSCIELESATVLTVFVTKSLDKSKSDC
jgi:hypothetical protein